MANINEIISEVERLSPDLARQLKKYVKDHSYGLVFEHNLPEAVRLYKKTPAIGDIVNILPPRGTEEGEESKVAWIVKAIDEDNATVENGTEIKIVNVHDLVTIVSYKDTIYPGLKEIDRIERGNPEDPYHMVINSENYHALEALAYCYPGKVDCIYIDPPYNTGAKDWKYNNDYVDISDQYRHSKWLAFMERRLKIAKQLLNPEKSVLIVSIDEKEYLRLGLLLEQLFPEAVIQMVTSVISAKGVVRPGQFSRVEEHIFFVLIGTASIGQRRINMLDDEVKKQGNRPIEWCGLRRREPSSIRAARPNQFYPIFVDKQSGRIVEIGNVVPQGVDRFSIAVPSGCVALWPLNGKGEESLWGLTPDVLRKNLKKGYVHIKKWDVKKCSGTVYYLASGAIEDIEEGRVVITGKSSDGAVEGYYKQEGLTPPKRVWNQKSHNAETYGTNLVSKIIGNKKFSFPKSLYAVFDALYFAIGEKKDATIIDFFAGSGTTLHAVCLLNALDGGHRRCICVTNNEISADEAKEKTIKGLRPGDTEWESHGIANYVTWPRVKCAIEGVDISGKALDGKYLESEISMSAGFKENVIFCELTYESAWPIRLDRAFDAIAPILWMQAGCKGPVIRKIGKNYLATDYYAVLFDYNQASKFCDKVKSTPTIKTVYVVTDDQRRYSNMCRRLPGVDVHRLYESYLKTFEICGEGGLD